MACEVGNIDVQSCSFFFQNQAICHQQHFHNIKAKQSVIVLVFRFFFFAVIHEIGMI